MHNKNEYRLEGKQLAFLEAQFAQLTALQQGINGALALILAEQELQGNWQIDWPARRLVRVDVSAAIAADQIAAAAEVREDEHATNNGRGR